MKKAIDVVPRATPTLRAVGGPLRSFASICTGAGTVASSVAKEAAYAAAHVALYPAGLLTETEGSRDTRFRMDNLGPLSRGLIASDIEAHGMPIVLLHGIGDNRSAFTLLRRVLRRRGFQQIITVNYSPTTTDVPAAAARLGRRIEQVCASSGYDQVHVVGHSLGGLIARYYVQRQHGDLRVNTVVTLGSPHSGTRLAQYFPFFVAKQLTPTSTVIQELAEPAQCSTRFVAIWSDLDKVIIPVSSAQLIHPDLDVVNVQVHNLGHLSLLGDADTLRIVSNTLAGRGARHPDLERRRQNETDLSATGGVDRRRSASTPPPKLPNQRPA